MSSNGRLPSGLDMLTWVRHSFTVPESVSLLDAPKLSLDLLSIAIDAYHRSNPGFPRYRALQSTMGFHIVPTDSQDEAGVLRSTKSLLDAPIEVLTAQRTASEHVGALLDTVTEATHVSTRVENPLVLDSCYAANAYTIREPVGISERPYMLFEWGASEVTAREALVDLLAQSATTMSWQFVCLPDYHHGNQPMFRIGFEALVVNGRVIWFDRCTHCRMVPTQK